jgi:hypothetical protein
MNRIVLMIGMLAAGFGTSPASLAASEELGRLFYTPAQRAQLDSARTRKLAPAASPRKNGLPVEASAPLRFDGTMIRSDGKTTHWVDGKPQSDRSGIQGLKPGQIRADGQVYEPYQVLRPTPPGPATAPEKVPAP